MIYERQIRYIEHTHIKSESPHSTITTTLVHRKVSTTIFTTCKAIFVEGKPFAERAFKEFVLDAPPRLITTLLYGDKVLFMLYKVVYMRYMMVNPFGVNRGMPTASSMQP
jgi:hypothetical protein